MARKEQVEMPPTMAAAEPKSEEGPAPARPMLVCVVTETYPPDVNGCAMTMGRLVDGLLALGHRVQLVRPRQHEGDVRRAEGRLTVLPRRGMPIPCYRMQQFGLPAGRSLGQLWRSQRPDVVYVTTEGPLGLSALVVARNLELPVVTGFHTNFQSYSVHYRIGFLKSLILRYMKAFHRHSRCTLVPTQQMRRDMSQDGFGRVEVVGRGVDTELYHPRRRSDELRRSWGAGPDDLVALYVGRIADEKNLNVAVRAFHAMREANPRCRFVLVGDGPARTRIEGENPDFLFCGIRTGSRLARHYASGDVFLFPSLTETFGNVTTEAMASGLAVVAYDYAAAGMHVTHGSSGMLAPYDCEPDFIECAVRLAREPGLAAKQGANARTVAETITWEHVSRRFERILRDCAKAGPEP
jgi:glycosyltransferase involved in cell wall biosynthesis